MAKPKQPPVEFPIYNRTGDLGAVYVIHLEQPISQWAGHYIGFVNTPHNATEKQIRTLVKRRDTHHRKGTGSRMLAWAASHQIEWKIVRIYANVDRNFERHLKRRRNTWKMCLECRSSHIPAIPWTKRKETHADASVSDLQCAVYDSASDGTSHQDSSHREG